MRGAAASVLRQALVGVAMTLSLSCVDRRRAVGDMRQAPRGGAAAVTRARAVSTRRDGGNAVDCCNRRHVAQNRAARHGAITDALQRQGGAQLPARSYGTHDRRRASGGVRRTPRRPAAVTHLHRHRLRLPEMFARRPDKQQAYAELRQHLLVLGVWVGIIRVAPYVLSALQ